MGKSIIVPNADFSASAIPQDDTLQLVRSAETVRVLKVTSDQASDYGGFSQVCFMGNSYQGYTYAADVRRFIGRQVRITFCVGYHETILANGGFLSSLPSGLDVSQNGWAPTGGYGTIHALGLSFISTAAVITSGEANTWVSKTYTIPSGAKYLLFTSKYLTGGTAGAELVEEAES